MRDVFERKIDPNGPVDENELAQYEIYLGLPKEMCAAAKRLRNRNDPTVTRRSHGVLMNATKDLALFRAI